MGWRGRVPCDGIVEGLGGFRNCLLPVEPGQDGVTEANKTEIASCNTPLERKKRKNKNVKFGTTSSRIVAQIQTLCPSIVPAQPGCLGDEMAFNTLNSRKSLR